MSVCGCVLCECMCGCVLCECMCACICTIVIISVTYIYNVLSLSPSVSAYLYILSLWVCMHVYIFINGPV